MYPAEVLLLDIGEAYPGCSQKMGCTFGKATGHSTIILSVEDRLYKKGLLPILPKEGSDVSLVAPGTE